jgi:hypothetical protein
MELQTISELYYFNFCFEIKKETMGAGFWLGQCKLGGVHIEFLNGKLLENIEIAKINSRCGGYNIKLDLVVLVLVLTVLSFRILPRQ